MDIVKIRWLDSGLHLADGWDSKEAFLGQAVLDNMIAETVGFLIAEDDDKVVVGQTKDATDKWYSIQIILAKNILKITRLCTASSSNG